jgi:hypothetical protein
MASTYTANQGIEKMDTGDQSGTWGGTVNTNMDIIDRAISGVVSITLTGSTTTLTTTDGALTDGMYRVLVLGDGGDLGSDNTITISPNDQDKAYLVYNNLSADRNAIFTQGTGANATVQNGETAWIYADGGGSGGIVRTAVSSVKITDQDGDTQIQVEEGGDDDDTIRFDIAGAEDFTMSANSLNVLTGSVIALPDATVGAPALTNTGDLNTGVYFPAADTVGVVAGGTEQFRFGSITGGANPIPGGIKNLLLNGGFTVAQRPSVTGLGGTNYVYYATDGWCHYGTSSSGRYTASQAEAGTTDGPFRYCLKIDVTTADTDTSGNKISGILQKMEGQNLQHLNWGQATDDYPLALSFWVKSPKSGTHCVAVYTQEGNDSCCTEYTVTSADTWEYITVDFPAPGTAVPHIDNDSNASLWLVFPLMATGTYQATADVWRENTEGYATSNQQNLLDNTGNDFFLANVQLELGSLSTSFAAENVGTTLEKCQRYFWRQTRVSSTNTMIAQGKANTTTIGEFVLRWSTEMRVAPTLTVSDVTEFLIRHTNTTVQTTGLTAGAAGTKSVLLIATVSSGLTADEAVALQIRLDDDYLEFSAEL